MSRSYPQVLLEVIGQVALIDETRRCCHDRWDRAVSQKLARPLDTYLDQVLVRRQPSRFPKCANDTEGCHAGPLRKRVERGLVGPDIGILEHFAYDAHDAGLTCCSAPPIQCLILPMPVRVAAYQFRDRNADCLLSRPFMETRAFRVIGSGSAMKSIGGSNCPVECLIRSSNT